MLSFRRPAALAVLGIGLAGITLGASGCSLASPATIRTPYAASDGTNADLDTGSGLVKFRNIVLVSSDKNSPGVLVGAISSEVTSGMPVTLTVVGTDDKPLARAIFRAEPNALTLVGSQAGATDLLQVSSVPVPPGSTLTLQATSQAGPGATFTLPVVSATRYYSSISPSASATSSPSVSASASASATTPPTSRTTSPPAS